MYILLTDEVKKERCKLTQEIFKINNLDYKQMGFCFNDNYKLVNYVSVYNKKTLEPIFVYELEDKHEYDFLSSFNLVIVLLFEQFKDDKDKCKDDDKIILNHQHLLKIKELYDFYDKKNDVLFEGLIFDAKDCANYIEQSLILYNNIKKLQQLFLKK